MVLWESRKYAWSCKKKETTDTNTNYSFRPYLPAPPTPNIVVIAAALDKTVETPTAIAEVPADREVE